MKRLTKGTWVLVADGQKALFLRNVTDTVNPQLEVLRKEDQDNPSDRAQSANRPGRMDGGGPTPRSALDDTDWHELAKERFADEMADILFRQAHRGDFQRIILVAPPAILGELRDRMHKEVAARVVAEIPKTLTNHPVDRMTQLIRAELDAG